MRRFVADVSHELRPPLAVIRGYAELVQSHRDEVPTTVLRAWERLYYQAARTTALVEELLLLARLDSGRPPALERVDLRKLFVEAVSDSSAAHAGHRWSLAVPPESPSTSPAMKPCCIRRWPTC